MLRHALQWNLRAWEVITNFLHTDLVVVAGDFVNLWADLYAHDILNVRVVRARIDLPIHPAFRRNFRFIPFGCIQRQLTEQLEDEWKEVLLAFGIRAGARIDQMILKVRCRTPRIALWPRWVIGAADNSSAYTTFGFVTPKIDSARSSDVSDLLRDGSLLVFVVGSNDAAEPWFRQYTAMCQSICLVLGCAGLLLGGRNACRLIGRTWFVSKEFVPLSGVLPNSVAVVHHGGIGTAAAALSAGVPQVIVPRVFAQPSNAEWLRRLGVAEVIDPIDFNTSTGAAAVRSVMGESVYRSAAECAAAKMCAANKVLEDVCKYLESVRRWPS